jgi:acyl carrier protein
VLSNAALVWNSVQFVEIVDGLEATTGKAVDHADLARISPLAGAHVIPSGTYRFPRAARGLE